MKKLRFKLFVFVLLVCLNACEQRTEWEIKPSKPTAVVDAVFTNEYKNHKVKFYSSSPELNLTPTPISGANFKLIGGGNEFTFTEETGNLGTYSSDIKFSVSAGITYRLLLHYADKYDTASAELVAITPIKPINIVASESNYRFVYSESSKPSFMEVSYDWTTNSEYCANYGACFAKETFYTTESIDISKTFAANKQLIEFPIGTTIIRRKYSLSDEHQDFIRSLLLETEWRGAIFDVEHGNVKTNFKNGTLGWFATCMVLTDTTIYN